MQSIKIKEVVRYGGHSLSSNGSVNLTLKAQYSELASTIKLMQLLNNDIDIKAKVPGSKAMRLGSFRIKQITIDGDGESSVKFNSISDYVEMDNLNVLPLNSDDNKEFVILAEGEVEEAEEGENESVEEKANGE